MSIVKNSRSVNEQKELVIAACLESSEGRQVLAQAMVNRPL